LVRTSGKNFAPIAISSSKVVIVRRSAFRRTVQRHRLRGASWTPPSVKRIEPDRSMTNMSCVSASSNVKRPGTQGRGPASGASLASVVASPEKKSPSGPKRPVRDPQLTIATVTPAAIRAEAAQRRERASFGSSQPRSEEDRSAMAS